MTSAKPGKEFTPAAYVFAIATVMAAAWVWALSALITHVYLGFPVFVAFLVFATLVAAGAGFLELKRKNGHHMARQLIGLSLMLLAVAAAIATSTAGRADKIACVDPQRLPAEVNTAEWKAEGPHNLGVPVTRSEGEMIISGVWQTVPGEFFERLNLPLADAIQADMTAYWQREPGRVFEFNQDMFARYAVKGHTDFTDPVDRALASVNLTLSEAVKNAGHEEFSPVSSC